MDIEADKHESAASRIIEKHAPNLAAHESANLTMAMGAALREATAAERERCAQTAVEATLPDGFQWGRGAMEQFNFGKKRAAHAIRILT